MRQVSASYGDSRRRFVVATSDGLLVGDDQIRTRFGVSCVAVGDTGMQTGHESVARTIGFEAVRRPGHRGARSNRGTPCGDEALGAPGTRAETFPW